MRVHLQIRNGDEIELDETLDWSPLPDVPESRRLQGAGFAFGRTDGYHGAVRVDGRLVRLKRRNRLTLESGVELRIDLYPHPSAVPSVRGACPSCGSGMQARQTGGAYRAIAREERVCGDCDAVVLGVRETADLVGRFADRSDADWVTVTTSLRCPDCLQTMTQGRLTTDGGEALVERCVPCNLLLIEPEDTKALQGEA